MISKPKIEGGLGVIDIEEQNKALLMKNLHKFFNREDLPWGHLVWEKHYKNGKLPSHIRKGSFCWRDNLKLLQEFKGFASPLIQNGESSLFWHDKWADQALSNTVPELFSFASNKLITVKKAFSTEDISTLFQLPLSLTAYAQLQHVQQLMGPQTLNDENDRWTYSWGSGLFSSAKVYRILVGHSPPHPILRWLWKSNCQPKHKVFFWLLIKDRLSTRNLLRRRNMQLDSYNCALCMGLIEETADHLFVECPFSVMCWDLLGVQLPIQGSFLELIFQIKDQLLTPFFMEAVILMCWAIWKTRNDLIFNGIQHRLESCRRTFWNELLLLQHRVKASQSVQFQSWIQSLDGSLG